MNSQDETFAFLDDTAKRHKEGKLTATEKAVEQMQFFLNRAGQEEIARLRAGIIKARDALDNYDYDTSLFDIMSELDDLLGDSE